MSAREMGACRVVLSRAWTGTCAVFTKGTVRADGPARSTGTEARPPNHAMAEQIPLRVAEHFVRND